MRRRRCKSDPIEIADVVRPLCAQESHRHGVRAGVEKHSRLRIAADYGPVSPPAGVRNGNTDSFGLDTDGHKTARTVGSDARRQKIISVGVDLDGVDQILATPDPAD